MGTPRQTILPLFAAAILAFAGLTHGDTAVPTGPEAVFQDRGLTHAGFWLVLPNEAAVKDGVWALKQADDGLKTEAAGRRNIKFALDAGRKNIDSLEDQYQNASDTYDKAVDQSKNVDKNDTERYNEWVETKNKLLFKLNSIAYKIDQQRRALEDLKDRESKVEDSRGRYITLVMDVGTKAESVVAVYDKLAKDSVLSSAITQANLTAQPPFRLGPTSAFADDLKFVRDCVKNVVSGAVPIQKSPSGSLFVQAVLNGNVPITMQWDTGADLVSLSPATVKALGIKDLDKLQSVDMQTADGRIVKSKLYTLDSVRLGAFTLHNVDAVLTPDIRGADPNNLLGDTFQSHFLSRLDQRSGQLQLTPIDSSIVMGPVAQPLPKVASDPNPNNPDLARKATATAESTAEGASPDGAIDGVIDGAPNAPQHEWASGDQMGTITLTWPDPLIISSVKLWDRPNKTDHILRGHLVFDDGTSIPFGALPKDGSPLNVRFRPKYVKTLKVEILSVSKDTEHAGFAEIGAYR